MGNTPDDEKSQIAERENLKMRCKLKVYKMQDSSGQMYEVAHPRQEEVDELAKTDLEAAANLADQIRQEDSLRKVKSTIENIDRRANDLKEFEARKAKEAAQAVERLEVRQRVGGKLEALGKAQTMDSFFDAAEILTEEIKNLSDNDLKLYAGARDAWQTRRVNITREQAKRFDVLEKLDDEVVRRKPANAEFFPIQKKIDLGLAKPEAPKPIVKPPQKPLPSFIENVRSLFGLKKKE